MPDLQTRTAELRQLDDQYNIHPFCDGKELHERGATIIAKGSGSYVWDSDGNRILDGMAGLWCVNIGYGRDELADVASSQMRELPFYNMFFQSTTPAQISLAKRLAEITPEGLNHFFFANSGSEANDSIVRLVVHFWKTEGQPEKRLFIGRNLGYHGSTLAAVSLGGMKAMQALGHEVLPDFHHIPEPHHYVRGGDLSPEEFAKKAAAELETKIVELGAKNVAAFIAEPIQGAGGVIDPPPGYWPEIQRICRKHDVLLVVDEVICGFGRLGEWFGSQYYDVTPDIMPMAKGLSSGYLPISAVAFNERISEALRMGGTLTHGFTYSGHPVSCAVAEANIDIIERENLVPRTREEIAPYFRKVLQQIADAHPLVGELRGQGLLAAMQLMKDRDSKTFFEPSEPVAIDCRETALQKGLIFRAVGSAMVLCPPLVITRQEIDELADITAASLDATAKAYGIA
ncbi:aspartate aminotransferase family protein [Pacificimonas flava]|uniref:Aspartate aminotransferase family protein n=2 Tax=Pacificimonas TaxID=1960290 RepID=A0A219B7E0_9SPHN|nr:MULTISPECIES: aminotransferase [Pacificimonas]MBZ6378529.1 aminotransferase class III-fold pyridoxal phosphate-dependent enzyme [Pacificimonas aurantium]OWV34181.1 aspartate aminotransferase family protein [Pacificimonas flava]